jgi:hypothetical protein
MESVDGGEDDDDGGDGDELGVALEEDWDAALVPSLMEHGIQVEITSAVRVERL